MILPVSVVSTDGFSDLRELLQENFRTSWMLNFAERPAKLFTGVEKRLTIWLGHRASQAETPEGTYLSNYRRWFAEERPHIFGVAAFVDGQGRHDLVGDAIPKVSRPEELKILEKLATQKKVGSFLSRGAAHLIYYTRKLRYFVLFLNFIPGVRNAKGDLLEPTELKELRLSDSRQRDTLLAALNSNLFFWFFTVYSDVRNVNRREILAFRCSLDEIPEPLSNELKRLGGLLMEDFNSNAQWLTANYGNAGALTVQSFQPRRSKAIIDEIDLKLAKHLSLTEEDVDFLTNFDIKYRMGSPATGEAEAVEGPA